MAFSVNTLPEYIDQHKVDLLSASVFGAQTIKHINIQSGVKHSAALNILSTEIALQARACGWNSNGTATFTQRNLEVGNYMVNVSLCEQDLKAKYMNNQLIARVGEEVLPFEEKIADEFVKNIQNSIEALIWTADKSAGAQFDGLLTIAKADAVDAASSSTTVYGRISDVYSAIPADVLDKAAIFVGVDTYRTLCLEMVAKNLYHYDAKVDAENMEIVFPGTTTRVIAVSGLNGTGAIVAADPQNLYYGCDMQDDAEVYKMWYSEDNAEFRFKAAFNAGTQIAFPAQVVYDI